MATLQEYIKYWVNQALNVNVKASWILKIFKRVRVLYAPSIRSKNNIWRFFFRKIMVQIKDTFPLLNVSQTIQDFPLLTFLWFNPLSHYFISVMAMRIGLGLTFILVYSSNIFLLFIIFRIIIPLNFSFTYVIGIL